MAGGREERQDINKLRRTKSDVPPRSEGVKEVDTSKSAGKSKGTDKQPKGYKGSHRDK